MTLTTNLEGHVFILFPMSNNMGINIKINFNDLQDIMIPVHCHYSLEGQGHILLPISDCVGVHVKINSLSPSYQLSVRYSDLSTFALITMNFVSRSHFIASG